MERDTTILEAETGDSPNAWSEDDDIIMVNIHQFTSTLQVIYDYVHQPCLTSSLLIPYYKVCHHPRDRHQWLYGPCNDHSRLTW
jgi:hypothetical protein